MKYILKTNKLLLRSSEMPDGAFIYSGSPNEGQKNKGKLIVILDFPKNTKNAKELSNILIQKIHKLYYQSNLIDQEAILENILEEVNENLPVISEIDNSWIKRFNALIAIIYRQEVYFSPLGNISAWTTNDHKLINIFDYLETNIDKPSINKIFTNILSGNIEAKQLLFFTTNQIFEHLSKETIEKIVINNEPAGIILKFKELLNKIKNENFCLVSVKLSPYLPKIKNINKDKSSNPKNEQKGININISPQESIDKLLNTQQATEEILSKGKSSLNEINENINKDLKDGTNLKIQKKKNNNLNKNLKIYLKTYILFVLLIFQKLFSFIKKIFVHHKKTRSQTTNTKNTNKNKIIPPIPIPDKAFQKIIGGKNIIIIAIIILLGFISSIFIINKQKKLNLEKKKYSKILQNINEKQEEYDLLLIYNNENQAKNKLDEISQLINKLPQRTKSQKEKYNEILDKFTETLNKTRKLNTIKNPKIIANFNFKPVKIVKYKNNLVALGSKSTEFSSLDLKTKKIEKIYQNDVNYNQITSFNKDKKFVYGLEHNDKIIKIDLDKQSAREIPITYHPNFKRADDLMIYNDKIYILDAQNNQIYKHNQNSESFGKGNKWIKNNTQLQNATCFSIDGNIYVGTSNGEIKKFYTGEKVEFKIEKIDPIIKNINSIFTDLTINEIYILDNKSKRIIIINKEGKLINQFYFPTLNMMNNFIVDGAAQKIYIQSENKIISLDIKK